MMWLISRGLHLTALTAYGISAALIILGLLTIVVALFTGDTNAQIGGLGTIVFALAIAGTTLTTMHCYRRSTR